MKQHYIYMHTEVDYGLRFTPKRKPRKRTRAWIALLCTCAFSTIAFQFILKTDDSVSALDPQQVVYEFKATPSATQQALVTPAESDNTASVDGEPATLLATAQAVVAEPTPPATTPFAPGWREIEIKSGDTLAQIFATHSIDPVVVSKLSSDKSAHNTLKKIKPGQTLNLLVNDKNQLEKLEYAANDQQDLHITFNGEKFSSKMVDRPVDVVMAYSSATINDSLFMAGARNGLDNNIIMQMVDIFRWDIDFVLDIQPGDKFSILYEEHYVDGKKIKSGNVLAAEFMNRGKRLQAVRYEDPTGFAEYYTPEGRALQKAFIRTPVEFARVSSRFNLRRKHPILHSIRAHKGVDYAAPRGTPIRATGNGTVTLASYKGGYGKTVEIQHGSKYSTLYAHMNAFAKNIKKGTKVKQGQVIGYIGSTGMATGPHLHYEFRVNGVHQDPLTVKLPNDVAPIEKKYLPQFYAHAETMLKQLNYYRSVELAKAGEVPADKGA